MVSRVYGNVYWYLTAVEPVGFAGMALGSVLMGVWGGFNSRLKTFALALFVLSIMTIGMGVSPYYILYLVLMFVYNIALTMIQTATTTIIQEKADSSMQGRVFGLNGNNVFGISSRWNGNFGSDCRCDTITMDYGGWHRACFRDFLFTSKISPRFKIMERGIISIFLSRLKL